MMKVRTIALLAASSLASLLFAACGADDADVVEEVDDAVEFAEASGEDEDEDEPEEPVPTGPPKRIFAKKFVVPVRSAPSRDADRIGFLRAGAVLLATSAEPVGFERCAAGWYELTTGGFVCNGPHVTAFEGRRLPAARGRQPDRDAPLPYAYGFIRRAKAPMYRRPPTDEEAAQYEGYRIPGAEPEEGEESAGEGGEASAMTEGARVVQAGESGSAMVEAGSAMVEAGSASTMVEASEMVARAAPAASAMAAEPERVAVPERGATTSMSSATLTATATAAAPSPQDQAQSDAAEDAEDSPTLATLMGDRHSVVARWVLRGFFISLDRDFRRGARRYWRTQSNGFVPYAAVVPRNGSTFQGAHLLVPRASEDSEAEAGADGAEPEEAPVGAQLRGEGADVDAPAGVVRAAGSPLYAWVLANPPAAYEQTERGGFRRARGRVARREGFMLTGAHEESRDQLYYETVDGRWLRDRDIRIATVPDRPPEVGEDEKWIDVELESQVLVAMIGDRAIYTTLVSSGKADRGERPGGSWETPSGLWRIRSKHLTDTMDGDTAVDGPYSVDDVPYVMYFELAYAMHTAFWHDGFGYPRSHGCVNLAPEDSRFIFNFAEPPLPEGWHSVYPTEEVPGTWIRVRGTTRGRR